MKVELNTEGDIVKDIILNVTPTEWIVISIALEKCIRDRSMSAMGTRISEGIIETVMTKLKESINE